MSSEKRRRQTIARLATILKALQEEYLESLMKHNIGPDGVIGVLFPLQQQFKPASYEEYDPPYKVSFSKEVEAVQIISEYSQWLKLPRRDQYLNKLFRKHLPIALDVSNEKLTPPTSKRAKSPYVKSEAEKMRQASAKALLDDLSRPRPTLVVVKVAGVSTRCLPASIGKVTFQTGSSELFETVLGESQGIKVLDEFITDYFDLRNKELVYATTTVHGLDATACTRQGISDIKKTADLLNFYGRFMNKYVNYGPVVISQETPRTRNSHDAVYFFDETSRGVESLTHWNGDWPLGHQESMAGIMDQIYFEQISRAIFEESGDPIIDRAARSIVWAGRSFVATDFDYQFLTGSIAAESLLIAEDNASASMLAERWARLLASDKDIHVRDVEALKKRLTELYGKRSSIVHRGDLEVTLNEVRDLHHYLIHLIATFLRLREHHDFKSTSELRDFLNKFDTLNKSKQPEGCTCKET